MWDGTLERASRRGRNALWLYLLVRETPAYSAISVVISEQERQDGCAFIANGAKFARVDAQRLQYGRSNLRSGHGCLDRAGVEFRIRDDQPDVGVAEAESTVFGIFLGRMCVGRAVNRLHQDIG